MRRIFLGVAAAAGMLCLGSGCATPHAAPRPVFYPPPPAQPRLQFLKSYGNSDDLGGQSAFARFIVGKLPPKPIAKPYGVTVHSNSFYVCDTALRAVSILNLKDRRMDIFAPEDEGRLRSPINMSIDADGTRYVADALRGQVVIFSPRGEYAGAIGALAAAPSAGAKGQAPEADAPAAAGATAGMKPTDVAITSNRLYVTDLKAHCVRVYDKASREPLFTIPRGSTAEVSRLFQPTNLAVDRHGRLYVSDTGGFRVQVYDADGAFVRSFGQHGDRYGDMALPKGVAVDQEDRVYVVDARFQVVQVFDPEGRLLLVFGEPGASAASLYLPAKIAIDYENVGFFQKYAAPGFRLEYLVIVTNQIGGRKVSVYGFGHPM